jgi:hypothetical protein
MWKSGESRLEAGASAALLQRQGAKSPSREEEEGTVLILPLCGLATSRLGVEKEHRRLANAL